MGAINKFLMIVIFFSSEYVSASIVRTARSFVENGSNVGVTYNGMNYMPALKPFAMQDQFQFQQFRSDSSLTPQQPKYRLQEKDYTIKDYNSDQFRNVMSFNDVKKLIQDENDSIDPLESIKVELQNYPNVQKLALAAYSPDLVAQVEESNFWFPTVNSVTIQPQDKYAEGGWAKTPIKSPSKVRQRSAAFWNANPATIYKKTSGVEYDISPGIDRLNNAFQIQKAIDANNLEHIAVAQKSLVKDAQSGWVIVYQGIDDALNIKNDQDYSLENSLTLDEVKDLVILAEETGFTDWHQGHMNMIRDKNNDNKLTIIDTESKGFQPLYLVHAYPAKKSDKLGLIKLIKDRLGVTKKEEYEMRNNSSISDTRDSISLSFHKWAARFNIKPEIRDWINDRIAYLSQQPEEPINSILSDDNKYNELGINSKELQQEFKKLITTT